MPPTLAKAIATVFFIGRLPVAPGTFGSLAGALFLWMLQPGLPLHLTLIIAVFALGVWCAGVAERALGEEDCGSIVIDEFVGYMAAVVALPLTAGYMAAAFVLFRFFDIVKPPPVRTIERATRGGLGIMLDDLAAGAATNVILQLWLRAAL